MYRAVVDEAFIDAAVTLLTITGGKTVRNRRSHRQILAGPPKALRDPLGFAGGDAVIDIIRFIYGQKPMSSSKPVLAKKLEVHQGPWYICSLL
jgi:hypothetical protein